MLSNTKRHLVLLILIVIALSACNTRFGSLKKEQFDILKQSVSQILGKEYQVKKINISNEGYTNEDKTEYVVDFTFDLNKPLLLLPSSNIPGKFIFSKDESGGWLCVFNSGNPGELFNIFR
ncbi:MAG: hypothetical protein Q8M98_09330 [Candidatus Cloacimonadaceae bacterium]|nr:hypothetical protein [Candidatus Cloacimonadaceae bacterium]MDP3114966.1 hypothetical protein [Candidatus Cloacimonadaceae bacterium]